MAAPTLTQVIVKQATLPVLVRSNGGGLSLAGSRFPINRIFCVGRNYRDHALEMGGDPDREPPFFFMKPADAIVDTHRDDSSQSTCVLPYPSATKNLHFEAELVVAIGREGRLNIPVEEAENLIFGYAVGCDLTRRDLQAEAKKKGRPWCSAKGFDYSAPCAPIIPKEKAELKPSSTILSLTVNNDLRQETFLDKMVWNVSETISYLSTLYRLKPGDLLFTGTPAGVGKLEVGDVVNIKCGELPLCEFEVGPPETE